jgi:N-acetylneuraminic acid mutarotase
MKSIKILLCLSVFTSTLHAAAWVSIPNFLGTARLGAVAFSIGNVGYVGTGRDAGGVRSDFWAYDATAGTWSQKKDYPIDQNIQPSIPSENNIAFVINGIGYVGMGSKTIKLFAYNPSNDTWSPKASITGVSDFLGSAFAIGTKGYFRSGDPDEMKGHKAFWEYDSEANSGGGEWTRKTDLGRSPTTPDATKGLVRRGAAAFSIGGKGYMGGGLDSFSIAQKDFYEYDPVSDSWTQVANYPGSSEFGTVSFSTSTNGYVGLGAAGANELWVFTPGSPTARTAMSGSWSRLPITVGSARQFPVGFSIGDNLFIGLGNDGALKQDFYKYDPSIVLSVELTNFSAVMDKNNARVALNWTTANEQNNAYFAVERKGSLDDNFQEVGRVKGAGNSSRTLTYRLLDNQPLQGIAYYRLRSVDNKESVTYSQTVSVTYEKGGKIVVFPSNTEGPVTVDVGARRIDETNVFSTTGQLVLRGNQSQIDLSNLPRGLYFVQVKTENQVGIQKVFKQ